MALTAENTTETENFRMTLRKHAARTNRKPCYCHNSTAVYWAHDTNLATNKDGSPIGQCQDCGETGKMVLVDANDFTRTIPVGGEVPEEYRHKRNASEPAEAKPTDDLCDAWACGKNAVRKVNGSWYCEKHAAERDSKPQTPPKPSDMPSAKPAAQAPSADAGDAVQQALATLAAAMGPKIDPEDIRAMVREEFNNAVFPTRTVIKDTSGNDVTPENMPDISHEMLSEILTDIMAAAGAPNPMSVLMVGPAGSGKSTLAQNAAEALGMSYGEISLNPMLPVTSLLGYMDANGNYVRTVFRDIWETGGVFHADEFDNGHPSTLAALNAALAKGRGGAIAFPDGMVQRHDDFIFIASANTFGRGPDRVYTGRQQLDAATLNRFIVEEIGYDESLEHQVCLNSGLENEKVAEVLRYVRDIRRNITSKKMTVLMTPRNAVNACVLLKAGKSWSKVHASAIRQGVSDADWSKATEGVIPPRL